MRTEHRLAARSKRTQQMALAEDLEEEDGFPEGLELPAFPSGESVEQTNKAAEVPLVQRSVT